MSAEDEMNLNLLGKFVKDPESRKGINGTTSRLRKRVT